jgi:nitrite reductase/ring-hydroxylating ferredoxin subunit|tara:strand:- start:2567 stop:3037 length:471 start_codon:yes stop_codon:yes gene_type:complete
MKNLKRREFINDTCPKVAMAMLGVSFLDACSKDPEEDTTDIIMPDEDSGYVVDGKKTEIDLSHPAFNSLESQGWMNFTAQRMLLVKTETSYLAFNNFCPHQGARNAWSYNSSESIFICGRHNNSYPTDCVSEGTNSGPLQCYSVNKNGNTLIVTKP